MDDGMALFMWVDGKAAAGFSVCPFYLSAKCFAGQDGVCQRKHKISRICRRSIFCILGMTLWHMPEKNGGNL